MTSRRTELSDAERSYRRNFERDLRTSDNILPRQLSCTICDRKIFRHVVKREENVHSLLGVLVCLLCSNRVRSAMCESTRMSNKCQSCFRQIVRPTVNLISCKQCPRKFCRACISKLSGATITNFWQCFLCHLFRPLWLLRAQCEATIALREPVMNDESEARRDSSSATERDSRHVVHPPYHSSPRPGRRNREHQQSGRNVVGAGQHLAPPLLTGSANQSAIMYSPRSAGRSRMQPSPSANRRDSRNAASYSFPRHVFSLSPERLNQSATIHSVVANLSIPMNTRVRISLTSPAQSAPSTLPSVHQENKENLLQNRDDDPSNCVICFEEKSRIACSPCGHVCLCERCLPAFKQKFVLCPMCNHPYSGTLKIYW